MMQNLQSKTDKLNFFYKVAAIASLLIVILIPIQIFIFIKFPPPENVSGFFEIFNKNSFIGLLDLDLLYIFNNTFLIFIYAGLFVALYKTNLPLMTFAILFGFAGIITYFSSTVCFEMMSLSNQFQFADSVEVKNQLLAAGNGLLVTYKGTAFDIYYVFNAIALIIISVVMFKNSQFKKSDAVWGLTSGVLMIIPSTAGKIGLIFSLLSLIPWTVFSIIIFIRFINLCKNESSLSHVL